MNITELWSGRQFEIYQLNLPFYLVEYFPYNEYLKMIENSPLNGKVDVNDYDIYIKYLKSLNDDLIFSFDEFYTNDFIEWEGVKGKRLRITI